MIGAVTWQGVLTGALLFALLVGVRAVWARWGAIIWRAPLRCRKCTKRIRVGGGSVCWTCSAGGKDISKLEALPDESLCGPQSREAKREAYRREMLALNSGLPGGNEMNRSRDAKAQ